MILADVALGLEQIDSQLIYSQDTSSIVFLGQIDRTKNQCIGVYSRTQLPPNYTFSVPSSNEVLPVDILVHWGTNYSESEAMALKIYDWLSGRTQFEMGNSSVILCTANFSHPTDIGRDSNLVQEFVCSFQMTYSK